MLLGVPKLAGHIIELLLCLTQVDVLELFHYFVVVELIKAFFNEGVV